jgi:hypothetical protein
MYNKEYNILILNRIEALKNKNYFLFYKITTKMYFFPLFYYYLKIKNKIWFKIKYNNDEFNESLNLNINKYSKLNKEEKNNYINKLIRERNKAHEMDCDNNKKGII